MKIELNRIDKNYHFEGIGTSKVPVNIDGSEEIGGSNSGARPMELILMGLGSCGAMDIISILKKQREDIQDLKIEIDGKRAKDKIPSVFTDIHIKFNFFGELNRAKVKKAVDLSMQKYCSVSAMLEQTAKITYSFEIYRLS